MQSYNRDDHDFDENHYNNQYREPSGTAPHWRRNYYNNNGNSNNFEAPNWNRNNQFYRGNWRRPRMHDRPTWRRRDEQQQQYHFSPQESRYSSFQVIRRSRDPRLYRQSPQENSENQLRSTFGENQGQFEDPLTERVHQSESMDQQRVRDEIPNDAEQGTSLSSIPRSVDSARQILTAPKPTSSINKRITLEKDLFGSDSSDEEKNATKSKRKPYESNSSQYKIPKLSHHRSKSKQEDSKHRSKDNRKSKIKKERKLKPQSETLQECDQLVIHHEAAQFALQQLQDKYLNEVIVCEPPQAINDSKTVKNIDSNTVEIKKENLKIEDDFNVQVVSNVEDEVEFMCSYLKNETPSSENEILAEIGQALANAEADDVVPLLPNIINQIYGIPSADYSTIIQLFAMRLYQQAQTVDEREQSIALWNDLFRLPIGNLTNLDEAVANIIETVHQILKTSNLFTDKQNVYKSFYRLLKTDVFGTVPLLASLKKFCQAQLYLAMGRQMLEHPYGELSQENMQTLRHQIMFNNSTNDWVKGFLNQQSSVEDFFIEEDSELRLVVDDSEANVDVEESWHNFT